MRKFGTAETTIESNWDRLKLVQMGVDENFVNTLNEDEARDICKGLLYAHERYNDVLQ
jgi:hypothetical protein